MVFLPRLFLRDFVELDLIEVGFVIAAVLGTTAALAFRWHDAFKDYLVALLTRFTASPGSIEMSSCRAYRTTRTSKQGWRSIFWARNV